MNILHSIVNNLNYIMCEHVVVLGSNITNALKRKESKHDV